MDGPKEEVGHSFELDEAVAVSVGDSEITGVVDMYGYQRNHEGVQYLVEWVDGKGTVNSHWFNENKMARVA